MATWATDVRGLNLAQHAPTAGQQRLARHIARRWAHWQPILLLELRKHPRPPGFVAKEMLRLEAVQNSAIDV